MIGHVPPEEQLISGVDLRLSCVVVMGNPKPELFWYKDGVELEATDTIVVSVCFFFQEIVTYLKLQKKACYLNNKRDFLALFKNSRPIRANRIINGFVFLCVY